MVGRRGAYLLAWKSYKEIFYFMESDNKPSKVYRMRVELAALVILIPLVLVLGTVLVRWPDAGVGERAAGGEAVVQAEQLVTLVVDGPDGEARYEVSVGGETTVAQVLATAEQYGLRLSTRDYGGELGVFVEAINGVSNDGGHNMYWYLYVNGQVSPVGASAAIVAPGDTVTWKYEKQHEEN